MITNLDPKHTHNKETLEPDLDPKPMLKPCNLEIINGSKTKPIMVRVLIDSDSNVLNLEQFTTKDSEPIVQFSIQDLNF